MTILLREIWKIIFSNLDFDDLIIVREVCLQFQSIIDHLIKTKPLVIKKINESKYYYRMYGVKNILTRDNVLLLNSLLTFRLNVSIHEKITKLIIYNPFVLINLKLDNLIHLEIKNSDIISKNEPTDLIDAIINIGNDENIIVNLKFKNLKILYFKVQISNKLNFIISSDKLETFGAECNLNKISVLSPKKVTTLFTNKLSNELANYKNLINLTVETFNLKNVNYNIIKSFTKLKVLNILDTNAECITKIIKQKNTLKSTIKINFKNIDTSNSNFDYNIINRINSIFLDENSYQTYLTNLPFIHNQNEFTQIGFIINNNLNVQMNLFTKFINIKLLVCKTHRIGRNNWIRLLESLNLDNIIIESSTFEQSLIDLIPKHSKNLMYFTTENCDSLNFVFELDKLERITVNEFIDLEIVKRMFLKLKNLQRIGFYTNDAQHYSLELKNDLFIFKFRDKIIFSDTKTNFLTTSMLIVKSWSELIDQDSNAICEDGIEI